MPVNSQKPNREDYRFAKVTANKSIWAIPSIHGALNDLCVIHDQIFKDFEAGDKVIYLGNYTGYSQNSAFVLDEILGFRRSLLTIPGVIPKDIIYLRGAQEEMMQKLLQIQFAPHPRAVIDWMLQRGLAQTLESYGVCIPTLQRTAGQGVIALSRWTDYLRSTIRQRAGHDILAQSLVRAAIVKTPYSENVISADDYNASLFVSGGLDFSKPLEQQGDALWWGKDDFTTRTQHYGHFSKVLRGYDMARKGLHLNCVTATLDNNSGGDGSLICAKIAQSSTIADIIYA